MRNFMEEINHKTKRTVIFILLMIIIFSIIFIYIEVIVKNSGKLFPGREDFLNEQKKSDKLTMNKTADLVNSKDPIQCDSVDKIINGVNYKTVCLNNIYYNMSSDNLDYGACEKLVDMSIEDCQKRVMLMSFSKEKDLAVCDKVPEKLKLSCPDAYWNFSAVDQKNPTFCARTSTPEIDLGCQNRVLFSLVMKKESFGCSSFSDSVVKNDCENYLKGNNSCELIKNSFLKDACSQKK
jgi:hypothetical protein